MHVQILVRGLVQGVGFRPFIYRIATDMGLKGEVDNRNDGVCIRVNLSQREIECFIKRIREEHPFVAFIHCILVTELSDSRKTYTDFSIVHSYSGSDEITQVAPDIAVCPECLRDREIQSHRIHYPFINCTHCGPRFSIIRDLPYDREQTTMSSFAMCSICSAEYQDIHNRRFHAQPVACNHCGPKYYATYNGSDYMDYELLLDTTVGLLNRGDVIVVKGIGGYHLICDATNVSAVARLRDIKMRDSKPFAVMFRDIDVIKEYAFVDEIEESCLTSWRRPIVLLRQHTSLVSGINPGMKTLGCMLPYMPIHYDWFKHLNSPAIVVTSGNITDVPIAISSEDAEIQFLGKVAMILHHNREIHNRVDDSVLQVCGNHPCLIRRSRGYVPEPFFADAEVEGILAFGAEKVNSFALGKGDTIIQSQYIGDLKNWETLQFYTESLERFQLLYRFTPHLLVADLHPDYLSSREAESLSVRLNLPLIRVQHHHAHAVACMLEYGIQEPVIAVVLDGTGLGDDGKIWGGEFFMCDRKAYKRLAHFEYVPLPGGDKASEEPWRMAVAYLWSAYGNKVVFPDGFIERIGEDRINIVLKMIEKKMNAPLTSSAGRLFDAVASLLGICDISTRQAEAPVGLEQKASDEFFERYFVSIEKESISFSSMIAAIISDMKGGIPTSYIAAKFHNTLVDVIVSKVKQLQEKTGLKKVVFSGGCFQNKRLTEQLQERFAMENISLFIPGRIPCNDSGIAIGQLTVASTIKYEKIK